jgi:hypothetical protein
MNLHGAQLHLDEDIERILRSGPEPDTSWRQQELEQAATHRLVPLSCSDPLVHRVLADGVTNYLGSGAFSRVYAIDETRALKFSRDLQTLEVMKSLQARCSRVVKVEIVMPNQATFGDIVYHAAIVERLEDTFPAWVRSVVSGYRDSYGKANSPGACQMQLNKLAFWIANGDIVIPKNDVAALSEAMRLLAETCWTERCVADLRYEGNFMMRKNGEVVISDPAHPVGSIND